jgi:class 3 adenylate cyclase
MIEGSQGVQYVRSGDGFVAYQVVGDGPLDLLLLAEWATPLEGRWEEPTVARPLERLASFARVITFDKRGIGLSDPAAFSAQSTPEEWVDDAVAVLSAVGSERAAVFGHHDGGHIAIMLAATHPDQVAALVLFNATARLARADDYPIGIPEADWEASWGASSPEVLLPLWGLRSQRSLGAAGSFPEPLRVRWTRWRREQASPTVAAALLRMNYDLDVRPALPAVQAPTLVLHRRDDGMFRISHGQYLAEHIAGARFVELGRGGHLWYVGDIDEALDEIEEFLTGARSAALPERVLATVLFTDIVGSTAKAASMGDRAWRAALDAHDHAAADEIARHRGRVVKHVGDGVLATFDGPARAIRCARAIRDRVDLEMRAGLHAGEIDVRGEDVGGISVHIAARVSAKANPGEVLVSRTVVDLVAGSGIEFEARGEHELKGVPGRWQLFSPTSA